jgi:hypothetical protein
MPLIVEENAVVALRPPRPKRTSARAGLGPGDAGPFSYRRLYPRYR